jgi:hypothetical protein
MRGFKVTIDHTAFSQSQVDFPVLLFLGPQSGINKANTSAIFDVLNYANRKKLAVVMDGGQQCSVEIVFWDDVSRHAELAVRVPSISNSADTILYLLFDASSPDNSLVGDVGSPAGQSVWDSNFAAVLHLVESGQGVAGEFKDSTHNANHGTGGNGNLVACPTRVLDEKGYPVQSFAGNGTTRSSLIQIPSAANLSIPIPGGFTVEAAISPHLADFGTNWTEHKTDLGWSPYISKSNPNSDDEWMADIYDKTGHGEGRVDWCNWYNNNPSGGQGDGSYTTGPIPLDSWVNLEGVSSCVDADHGTAEQFRNGVSQGSVALWETGNGGAIIHYVAGLGPVKIGGWDPGNGGLWFPGRIKEVRISQVARSPSWLFASSRSNNDNLISYQETTMANVFVPGAAKNPKTQVNAIVPGLACTAELYIGPDQNTKIATSGPQPFTSVAAPAPDPTVTFPIVMPGVGGVYHVFVTLAYGGTVFTLFKATEDVTVISGTVQPPVWG